MNCPSITLFAFSFHFLIPHLTPRRLPPHLLITMSEQEPKSTLRNRRTTVEDASDDSDTATTTATTTATVSSSKAKTKETKTKEAKTKKTKASTTKADKKGSSSTTNTGVEPQKPSQLRNLLLSLVMASLGVVLMSAYNKFVMPTREITIEQSIGLQGNCFQIASKTNNHEPNVFNNETIFMFIVYRHPWTCRHRD